MREVYRERNMKDITFENLFLFGGMQNQHLAEIEDCRDLFWELRDEVIDFAEKEGWEFDTDGFDFSSDFSFPTFSEIEKEYGKDWALICALSARPKQTLQLLRIFESKIYKTCAKMDDEFRYKYYTGYRDGYSDRVKEEMKEDVKQSNNAH